VENQNSSLDDPLVLYKCQALKHVRDKITLGAPVLTEELKLLTSTLPFLGEKGTSELENIVRPLSDHQKRYVNDRVRLARERDYLPVSCIKVRTEWELNCGDCRGAVTPIQYSFGLDPNLKSVEEIHLSDLDSKHLGRYVKADVWICGVGEPLSIPNRIEVKCLSHATQGCAHCSLAAGRGILLSDLRLELGEPSLVLEFAKISKAKESWLLQECIKKWVERAVDCPLVKSRRSLDLDVTVTKQRVLTPLMVMPALDEVTVRDAEARETSRRQVYLSGLKRFLARRGALIGPCLKHPRDGTLTILGVDFEPTEVDLNDFVPQPVDREALSILKDQAEPELLKVIGQNVCGIFGRPDAVEANLVAYHTPLLLIWKGEEIPGWVQLTNFGDSTTGKRIPRMIKQFIGLGTYVIVETSGRTGLLYSIDEGKEGHVLSYGEFPLSDRGLVIIDGYDRMQPEERAEFRESYRQGFLKVRRVVSGQAPMRVRIIACENVKQALAAYLYPCVSLLENYKAPDIARIDLAIPYRREDVAPEEIYRAPEPTPDWLPSLKKALKLSVQLAWSRRPDQVRFNPEAVEEIEKEALRLDEKYGLSDLPLVSRDFDKKLAKLSAGYAAWRCAYDQDWNLQVEREHVQHVVSLIERIYSSEGMRLEEYAKISRERAALTNHEYAEIREAVDADIRKETVLDEGRPNLPIIKTIIHELQARGTATLSELEAAIMDDVSISASEKTIKDRIRLFKKYRLVISTKAGYVLTAKGVDFMRRYGKEPEKEQAD